MKSILVYDAEIVKAIPGREPPIPGIEYCEGWRDFANMGVSVICTYDYREDVYHVYGHDNMQSFFDACTKTDICVGFNNIAFDNKLIEATTFDGPPKVKGFVPPEKCYDLLVEVWRAHGLGPEFDYPTHAGFGLDALAQANCGVGKSGNGALAPVLWQQGKHGAVIDYCLRDVWLTKRLLDEVVCTGKLTSPKMPKTVSVRNPFSLEE